MQEVSTKPKRQRKRGAYKKDEEKRTHFVQTRFLESELALIEEANTEGIALSTFIVQTVLNAIKNKKD